MKSYLKHHGILGQKWGLRRFQNKDGSYTEAGKKRYSMKDVSDDFDRSIDNHKDAYDRIKHGNNSITEAADSLGKEYENAFNNVKLDSQAKNRIINNLRADFGNGCDDSEYFEMCRDEYIDDEILSKVNSIIQDKRMAFEQKQDEYWKDVDTIISQIKEKYQDTKINDAYINNGQMAVNHLLGEKLGTRFNAYISRHFDDYWVMDTDAHYNARDRVAKELGLTMDEYNRKYAK